MSPATRKLSLLITLLAVAALAVAAAGATAAQAAKTDGWWVLSAGSAPTNLPPGEKGLLLATAVNTGFLPISGESTPIVASDQIPAGLEVTNILAEAGPSQPGTTPPRSIHDLTCTTTGSSATGTTISCPWTGPVEETESIRLKIRVNVLSGAAPGPAADKFEVSGGKAEVGSSGKFEEAEAAAINHSLTISAAATKFGVEAYEQRPETDTGAIDTQAGSHPFQLTTIFDLNQTLATIRPKNVPEEQPNAPALAKNLHFILPAGLVGKAAKVPRCSGANFGSFTSGGGNLCPEDTAIGYAAVAINDPVLLGYTTFTVPVFNLTPGKGEPALFGFEIQQVPVELSTRVLSGSTYGIEATVKEASEAAVVLTSQVTLWGVPSDARHNAERGWECLEGGWFVFDEKPCKKQSQLEEHDPELTPEAFLTMPAYCNTTPESTATGEAWNGATFGQGEESPISFKFSPFTGCEKLPFNPTITVKPDSSDAATPSGLTVSVKVPQESTLSPEESVFGEADIEETKLALPVGVQASAGAADGLLTCSSSGFGFNGPETLINSLNSATEGPFEAEVPQLIANDHFNEEPINETKCPSAAKIGTVNVNTPLLEEELTGSVYLAKENTRPFKPEANSPLVLFIFAESPVSNVQVKLAGEVHVESDGQLVSYFKHTPPVPFSELNLHLFDGSRASQSTPETCGAENKSVANFNASSGESASSESSFAITSGPGGAPCPAAGTQPFAPGFAAKSEATGGGEYSPFTVTIERPDGQQSIKSVSVTEPKGASAMLSSVTPCPIAEAETLPTPTCPESSKIGESYALSGLGSDAEKLVGQAYLTEGFDGAPFGLLDVTNATEVGPFDLGYIPVLSTITVNETTAQATVTTDTEGTGEPDPLPEFVKGVPSQIKKLVVTINRHDFTFNPTNCEKLEVTGTLTGWGAPLSEAARLPEGSEGVGSPYYASGCAALPFKPTISINVESNVSRLDGTGMKIIVKSSAGQANIHRTHLVFPSSVPSRLTTIQKACRDTIFDVNPANCDKESVIGTAIARTPVLKSPLTGPVYLVSHANAAFPDTEFLLQGEGIKLLLDGKTFIHDGVTSSTFEEVPDAPVETFEVKLPRGPYSAFSGYGNLCASPIHVPTSFGGQNGVVIEQESKVNVEGCGSVMSFHKESELAKLLKTCKKQKNHGKRVKCEANARKRASAITTCKKKDKGKKTKLARCEATARKKYVVKG